MNIKQSILEFRKVGWYPFYVLIILLLAYLLNQLDRYAIGVTSIYIAQDMHWGDKGCLLNTSYSEAQVGNISCEIINKTLTAHQMESIHLGEHVCMYNYNGQGVLFELLAGPAFIVVYTFAGIPLAATGDMTNRRNLLAGCLLFWSTMTFITGFTQKYWQLLLLRFAVGIGEAGCTPFATSIIADYFPSSLRAAAIGIYNWGIYTGYSLSFTLGDYVVKANILNQGWRWVYWFAAIPGFVIAIVIFATVREPPKTNRDASLNTPKGFSWIRIKAAIAPFKNYTLLCLVIAGSIRNAAGYVWAYNTKPFFNQYYPRVLVADYLTWIPLVAGSLGSLLGGVISDRLVTSYGLKARIWVLIASQVCSAPFALMALLLPPPAAFIMLIPNNLIGEMWIGVTLTVVVEIVPGNIRTSAIAIYLFIITNIGGLMPLLVPPLTAISNLRTALIVLFPMLYLVSSGLFLVAYFVHKLTTTNQESGSTTANNDTQRLITDSKCIIF
ncbi:uncharacterized protein TRIADDRAFT_20550 [Trichoplax adhaerens]|uniref:Major facilitator superfamily (MFS) profile domain-containing protein n=1 Tax=Trichoplax adhaerens TaxID=10228 RepID=B3RMW5_TRIAD|nr:hypothetical protein TRIADDRAFT_20550 [Trichoplax adhaerens]EDV27921.1 hypothetical protein TRIADDRAFT_20550 [Trichoplax adhaerens]|eukprot:XP_002109755.1 hypothetical protein TRIADDRAFT_20550 [Trichoplax adhaerens]